jgi:hypothetical protein
LGCAHWLYGKTLISGRAVSRHPTAAVRYRNAGGPQTTPSPSRVNDCARSFAAAALKRATPLILTVSGRFPQAIILQSRLTPGGHRETSTWSSCRRCRNHIGGGFGVGSGLTAQSGCAGIPRAGAGRSTRHAKSPAFRFRTVRPGRHPRRGRHAAECTRQSRSRISALEGATHSRALNRFSIISHRVRIGSTFRVGGVHAVRTCDSRRPAFRFRYLGLVHDPWWLPACQPRCFAGLAGAAASFLLGPVAALKPSARPAPTGFSTTRSGAEPRALRRTARCRRSRRRRL